MCGRYALTHDVDELIEAFDVPTPTFSWAPRYNIAPTQVAPVVAADHKGRRMGLMRWGLIPYWADGPGIGNRHINARSETVAGRPAFRDSFARRRCLVPATGFYEWARTPDGKRPFWIRPAGGGVLGLAGVWDRWTPDEGDPIYSFAILTVPAAPEVRPIHDRMPAIVPTADRSAWLARGADPTSALALLRPGSVTLTAHEVSTWVNAPANDDRSCIEPVSQELGDPPS